MSFTKINHYEKEYADTHHECALTVTEGVENQPVVNPYFVRKKKRALTTEEYVEGILQGNITTLSQAITLVESSNPDHYAQAQEIIESACRMPGNRYASASRASREPEIDLHRSRRQYGHLAQAQAGGTGHRPQLGAQRRFDPRRQDPHGEHLVQSQGLHPPLPFGRVARRRSPQTRETIILCEAAGFDVIFIETVGVGQSETAVHSMVDMFMMLQISGAGDELQGIKRGIMEMADMMVITKADGENIHKAELAKTQYQGALRLFPVPESGWRPKVYTCSAYTKRDSRRCGKASKSSSTSFRRTDTSRTTATVRTSIGCTKPSTRC